MDITELVAMLLAWLTQCDGITISGGEPFDQPDALNVLLHALRARRQTNVLVYSGYPIEQLTAWLERQPGLIDALITDPFDECAPQTLALRGSDNQRLHLLTETGRALFAPYERSVISADKQLDVVFDAEGNAWLAGIPRRGDLRRLQALLQHEGHRASTTMARPARPSRGRP